MKKTLFIFAVLVMAVAVPLSVKAYDFTAVSPSGHRLFYTLDTAGGVNHVKLTHQNPYVASSPYANPVYDTLPVGNVVIPDSVVYNGTTYAVTKIVSATFAYCTGLTGVTIPATVTSIGSQAFIYCMGISYLTVPSTVTSIGTYAFSYVRHVEYHGTATGAPWDALSMNGYVEGDFAYRSPAKDTLAAYLGTADTVTVPSTVRVITRAAFENCHNLTSVVLPDSLISLGGRVFASCNALTSVNIPEGVTEIPAYAFMGCPGLTSFVIPSTVTTIEMRAFSSCRNLMDIRSLAVVPPTLLTQAFSSVPDSAVITVACGSINAYQSAWTVFHNFTEQCGPYDLVFPYTHQGQTLYYRLKTDTVTHLTHATTSYPVLSPTTIDDIWVGYPKPVGEVVIPDTVEYNGMRYPVFQVGRCSFFRCDSITSVVVPEGVSWIGNSAFSDCTSLLTVSLPSTLTEMEPLVFSGDSALTTAVIPAGVTTIPSQAFCYCVSLQNVTIPEGVTSIGDYAFYSNHSLTSLTIPQSVTTIGGHAFRMCDGLASITLPDSMNYIGESCFRSDSSLTTITLPAGLTKIEAFTFRECPSLTTIVIPEGVTELGTNAFFKCYNLQSVSLPSTLTFVGYGCFAQDTMLASAVLPEGLTIIAPYAFSNCHNLPSVSLPSTLDSIGRQAFFRCYAFDSIVIPDRMHHLGYGAFGYCTGLKWCHLPAQMEYMDIALFFGTGLETVDVPEGVTYIDTAALGDCPSLHKVNLPASLTLIKREAFQNDSTIDTIILASIIPPMLEDSVFYYYTATLVVPCGAADAYRQHEVWGLFANIVENCEAIEEIDADNINVYVRYGRIIVDGAEGQTVRVYDMMGRRVSNQALPTGVYFVQVGTSPARKVVVTKY